MEFRIFVKGCQERWLERNAEILKTVQEETEAKAKKEEAERKSHERAKREKQKMQENELQQKKIKKEVGYIKEQEAKKQWESDQQKYLTDVLLKKKRFHADTLLEKRLPLIEMKEHEERKRSKPARKPYLDILQVKAHVFF